MKKTKLLQKFFLLMIFSTSISALQAQNKVSGVVSDENDKLPVVGATVVEIGTQKGTITDINGRYSITVNGPKSKLMISYIGKEPVTVVVGNQTNIPISLTDNQKLLDEVVVIGYGSIKKSDLTGSVSSMKLKDLEDSKSSSFTSSLAGRIAGVSVVQNGGAPGSGIDIKIRGASSVSAGTKPLYVIDGMMMENSDFEVNAANRVGESSLDPMAMINPDDIQSIEILKDASATAIYGSRGANGVVLITTKSSTTDGTNSISFTADRGYDISPQKRINVLSGADYEDYMGIKYPLSSLFIPNVTALTESQAKFWNTDGTIKRSGINRVWQDEIMQTGLTQNYYFSLRGSNKKTNYTFSAGYMDKQGIVRTSSMDRLTFSSKIDNEYNKYIKLGMNISGSLVTNRGVTSNDQQLSSNIFSQMLLYRPTVSNGDLTDADLPQTDPGNPINNPVTNLDNITQQSKSNRLTGKAYVIITPFKGLILNSSFGGYTNNAKSKNFYPLTTGVGRIYNGKVDHGVANITNWLNENTATYTKNINKDNKLTILGGVTFQRTILERFLTTATELSSENLGIESLKFGEIITTENSYAVNSLMSYLGRVNYDYKNKYLFTASLRADGSSKFAKGQKFSYFPSAAFAWKINEENFLKQIDQIDLMKFRLSYGMTGNQDITSLSNIALMNLTSYSFNTVQGTNGSPILRFAVNPKTAGNDQLKWETTSQYNAGLDILLFKSKINFTADVYYKRTNDLLISQQMPGITGFETLVSNIGSVENKGLELSLSTVNIKSKKFEWTTDFNITFNRNKVLELGNGDRIPVTPGAIMQDSYLDVFYVREGYPIGAMFGYQSDGLYQCSDFKEFYNSNGFISDPILQKEIYTTIKSTSNKFTLADGVVDRGSAVEPGFMKLKKQNEGTTINSDDRVYLGSAEPDFFGGLTNRFSYQNFELSLFLQYSYGNKLFNTNRAVLTSYVDYNIEEDFYKNMWLIDRQDAKYRVVGDGFGRQTSSDLQAEDASYIKLKDITLSYSLPRTLTRKLHLKTCKVYLSAQNLFTLTKYSWYDPEYSSSNPLYSGMDKYSYPSARTVMGGISINL